MKAMVAFSVFLICITVAFSQYSPFADAFGTVNPFSETPAINISMSGDPTASADLIVKNPLRTNCWGLVVHTNSAYIECNDIKPEIGVRLDNRGAADVRQFIARFRDWTQKCYSNDISEATKEIGRIGGLTYTFRYNSNAGFHSAWVESGPNIHLSWDDISAIRALLNLYPGAVQQLRARISSAPIEKLRVDDLLK